MPPRASRWPLRERAHVKAYLSTSCFLFVPELSPGLKVNPFKTKCFDLLISHGQKEAVVSCRLTTLIFAIVASGERRQSGSHLLLEMFLETKRL